MNTLELQAAINADNYAATGNVTYLRRSLMATWGLLLGETT